jgi:hypothetical protein
MSSVAFAAIVLAGEDIEARQKEKGKSKSAGRLDCTLKRRHRLSLASFQIDALKD